MKTEENQSALSLSSPGVLSNDLPVFPEQNIIQSMAGNCSSCHNNSPSDPWNPTDPTDPCEGRWGEFGCQESGPVVIISNPPGLPPFLPIPNPAAPLPGYPPFPGGFIIPPDIMNKVDNPCIWQSVEDAITRDCQNAITNFVNKVFGNNEKLDLQFNDNTLVGNLSNVDAYTETKSTGYQKSLTNITFNNVQLDSSSKEYIAATILHEVVHAWINYKYTAVVSNQYQHSLMAGSYRFNLMRIALQEMYPNLSTEDAIDLTWGGLTDTVEFSGLPVNERQRIIRKNIDFKKGLKGTHC